MGEADEVLGIYVDEASTWTVDVGDEQEGYRQDEWQDQKERPSGSRSVERLFKVVAEQNVAEDRDL